MTWVCTKVFYLHDTFENSSYNSVWVINFWKSSFVKFWVIFNQTVMFLILCCDVAQIWSWCLFLRFLLGSVLARRIALLVWIGRQLLGAEHAQTNWQMNWYTTSARSVMFIIYRFKFAAKIVKTIIFRNETICYKTDFTIIERVFFQDARWV